MRSTIVALIPLLVAACATPIATQNSQLAARPSCCQSLEQFNFGALAIDKEQEVALGTTSQVFDFPTGKSYFSAFRIPSGKSRVVSVESKFNGQNIGQFLQPIFLFLDSEKRPITALSPRLVFIPPAFVPYTIAHMRGGVAIPDAAEFVVIYTKDFSETSVSAPIQQSPTVFMSGKVPVVVPNGPTQQTFELSPAGVVVLKPKVLVAN